MNCRENASKNSSTETSAIELDGRLVLASEE